MSSQLSAIGIQRLFVSPVAKGITGTGPTTTYFRQLFYLSVGPSGVFQFSLANVVGSFSGLQINVEYSADGTDNWETVSTWTPLVQGIGIAPCAEAGFFRLNCTTFTGGTSFDVNCQIAPAVGDTYVNISGGPISVTQGTSPWVVQDTAAEASLATIAGAPPPSASSIASAIVSNPPTVDIKASTITALTPPTANAIGSAVAGALTDPLPVTDTAAESSLATIAAAPPPSASSIASAIVSNPPTVDIKSSTVTTLTPPTAAAIASAIVANPPAVTVTSGSVAVSNFPVTQPISAASLPLPANAAQETGGNLATIATQTRNDAQIVDLLTEVVSQLRLFNLNFAANMPGAYNDQDGIVADIFQVN
jgi:hypothetical protein